MLYVRSVYFKVRFRSVAADGKVEADVTKLQIGVKVSITVMHCLQT